jgi:hypothetical protein
MYRNDKFETGQYIVTLVCVMWFSMCPVVGNILIIDSSTHPQDCYPNINGERLVMGWASHSQLLALSVKTRILTRKDCVAILNSRAICNLLVP